MKYFLGVDTGATKSHALIADETGQVVGFGEAGTGNWESVGWAQTAVVLNDIVEQAVAMAGIERPSITAAGFGLAGYDWPEDHAPHVDIIEGLGLGAPFGIVNDAFLGLFAGTDARWGVSVAAGTSCNCYGRNAQGKVGRVTGSSSAFGERGGAMEVVQRAIHAVAWAWSQRGPATDLTEAFINHVQAESVEDLLAGLMRGRFHLSAREARLVLGVAAAGDEVAQSVVRWVGEGLGDLACGVIRQVGIEREAFDVVLGGSFFEAGEMLTAPMRAVVTAVAPQAQFVRLTAPPVTGGVMLAMEQVDWASPERRAHLLQSIGDFMQENLESA
jgi:N-acetylglucosamine kinase-like BadF-type ATPase